MSHIVPQQQATTSMPLPMMESQSVLSAPLQGYCWNDTECQDLEIEKCHPECLGCYKPNSSRDCIVCRNFKNDRECVAVCPENKFANVYSSICVTKEECTTMLNRTKWWIFQEKCVNKCPADYEIDESATNITCKKCYEHCEKHCQIDLIDNLSKLQEVNGCTHMEGSLDIRLFDKANTEQLTNNLGSIKVIENFLKIGRSTAIRSLSFLKNLRTIKGRKLENKKYAIFIYENKNLQKLWNFTDNFNLQILNGTLAFHNNPQLCLSEIHELANQTGLTHKFTDVDVSLYSNGEKSACNTVSLEVVITEINSTNVTLSWNTTGSLNKTTYIGSTVYYTKNEAENITYFESQDVCGENDGNGWDNIFTRNTTILLKNLTAFTKYAYYIKLYQSNRKGGQSSIKYFTTLSDDPSVILNVEAIAENSSVIKLTWTKPCYPNGKLDHYRIIVYREKDDKDFVDLRDYCVHEFEEKQVSETTTESPSMKYTLESTSDSCSCKNSKGTRIFQLDQYTACLDDLPKHTFDSCYKYHYGYEEDNIMVQKRGSVKKQRTRETKSSVFELTVDASLLAYKIIELERFTLYSIYFSVCNEKRNMKDQCSEVVKVSVRTKKDVNADIITKYTKEIQGSHVYLSWDEPVLRNSIVVAYHVNIARIDVDNSENITYCLSRSRNTSLNRPGMLPGEYVARLRAVSLAGPANYTEPIYFEIASPASTHTWIYLAIVIFLALIGTGSITTFYFWKKKKHFDNSRLITSINPDYSGPQYVEDEWEILRDDIELLDELGKGSFGMVYRGLIKSRKCPCAVKMMNIELSLRYRNDFLKEASVMKEFNGAHHVVRLLGVVSRGEPPLVVMELMERGDLKLYLRNLRDSSFNLTCNEIYRMAIEIADGMYYLATKKFVHRDLAARNCMVSADRTVKIGDFGMTRDIYQSDYYRKELSGLLPVRWMAPESLADGVCTSDSDVWSYGIVLWEMATLAEQPYQGLSNEQAMNFIMSGGKLTRPLECPDFLFEIMDACWCWNPSDRPQFSDIVQRLESHVGACFKIVSFYHSKEGHEYRASYRERTYNAPAMYVTSDREIFGHYNVADEEVALYAGNSDRSRILPYKNQSHPT